MSKVKLVYDLDKPNDVIFYNRAIKSSDLSNALYEISLINNDEELTKESIDSILMKFGINFGSLFVFGENIIVNNNENLIKEFELTNILKNGK